VRALADALRQGRACTLETIDLRGNPASGAARQAVRDALDDLIAAGAMKSRAIDIEVFGAPDEAAKRLQRQWRKKLKISALIARVTLPAQEPPPPAQQPEPPAAAAAPEGARVSMSMSRRRRSLSRRYA
jgi:hypothetical protein